MKKEDLRPMRQGVRIAGGSAQRDPIRPPFDCSQDPSKDPEQSEGQRKGSYILETAPRRRRVARVSATCPERRRVGEPAGDGWSEEEWEKRRDRTRSLTKALILILLFSILPLASAESPSRSIFHQARVTEPKVEKPASSQKKEELLIQAFGLGEIQIPETYGRIMDVYQGSSDKILIHIQDAHVHYEAQKNLSAILESLIQRNKLKLILVEGGNLRGELSSLRKLASRQAREEVAERYLRKGLLKGDEYLELVSDYAVIRQGIEDPALYEENLRAFLEVEKVKKKALERIGTLQQLLKALKSKMYDSPLLDLESKREAYDAEQSDLITYYQYLASQKSPENYPNIKRLLEASALEKEIQFDNVDDERNALIETLAKKMNEEEMNALLARSFSYKEGRLSQKDYYTHVKRLAEEEGLEIHAYPNLEKYVQYLALYGDIQHVELFKEGDRLEGEFQESLFRTEDERQLAAISKHVKLLSNLFQIKIAPDDYVAYQKDHTRFLIRNILPFLEKKIAEHELPLSIPPEVAAVDQYLGTMDRFYRVAQARDVLFVENSLKEMEKENVKVAVLKTGGFHTPRLTQILKGKGISYIVISPRITQPGNPELYYSILKEQSGSLVQ